MRYAIPITGNQVKTLRQRTANGESHRHLFHQSNQAIPSRMNNLHCSLRKLLSSSRPSLRSVWPPLGVLLISSVLLVLETSCTTRPQRERPPGPRLSIMTYNVENLFDTRHDEGKNDHTFLPLALKKSTPEFMSACQKNDSDYRRKECLDTDWSEAVLNKKLDRVADVLKQVGSTRCGPDIQILIEVENKNALELLRSTRLIDCGYQTAILLEGPDNRGIDPAILSRLPQWGEPILHLIPYKGESPEEDKRAKTSRGILEARLLLPDGQKLAVFAVHFPSQGNPTYLRKQAVEHLNKIKGELPADVLAIAGGDFNIIREEDQTHGYYRETLASQWLVSHLIGCKECEGTHYHHPKREWSFLDALLFSKAMKVGSGGSWIVDPDSIRTPNESQYQLNKFGNPARFEESSSVGVSDHYPVYAELYKPQSAPVSEPAQALEEK
jgi:endonuclease/exonuclease/phosphatase family metal-dependent hydrolase